MIKKGGGKGMRRKRWTNRESLRKDEEGTMTGEYYRMRGM